MIQQYRSIKPQLTQRQCRKAEEEEEDERKEDGQWKIERGENNNVAASSLQSSHSRLYLSHLLPPLWVSVFNLTRPQIPLHAHTYIHTPPQTHTQPPTRPLWLVLPAPLYQTDSLNIQGMCLHQNTLPSNYQPDSRIKGEG